MRSKMSTATGLRETMADGSDVKCRGATLSPCLSATGVSGTTVTLCDMSASPASSGSATATTDGSSLPAADDAPERMLPSVSHPELDASSWTAADADDDAGRGARRPLALLMTRPPAIGDDAASGAVAGGCAMDTAAEGEGDAGPAIDDALIDDALPPPPPPPNLKPASESGTDATLATAGTAGAAEALTANGAGAAAAAAEGASRAAAGAAAGASEAKARAADAGTETTVSGFFGDLWCDD